MSVLAAALTLGFAHQAVPGSQLIGDPAQALGRVHTDTRCLQPGDCFVALKGERFDAHDFLPQASAAGASALIAEHGIALAGLPGLEVPESLLALQQLAAAWRAAQALPLIAVTGSNGKTTVTQMVACILRAGFGERALATAGNQNNHIGVPLTLLRLRGHAAAVVELGMNHPGEIALLAAMARPTVALVNNAQREHLEFMQTVDAVAAENGSVITSLPPEGVAVFPADDAYAPLWRRLAGERRTCTFVLDGEGEGEAVADVTGTAVWRGDHWAMALHTPVGSARLRLQVAGRHNAKNALAATACALAAGLALEAVVEGLQAFEPVKGRCKPHRLPPLPGSAQPRTLIDDSYNANPDSVRAAIALLAELPGPRLLLLGDMGEVGDQGPAFHAEAGALARASGIEALCCAGDLSRHTAEAFGPGARQFANAAEMAAEMADEGAAASAFASVLVKGSRFMKMEQTVALLLSMPQNPVATALPASAPAPAFPSAEGSACS